MTGDQATSISLTKRQRLVVSFALHRFITDAYAMADKEAQHGSTKATHKFLQDAKDAEELRALIRIGE